MDVVETADDGSMLIRTEPALCMPNNWERVRYLISKATDTGAPISVIGESEAKELGIRTKRVEGRMGDANGQGVSRLQLGFMWDLRTGGLYLRDVPFVVIADTGEPCYAAAPLA